MKIGWGTYPNHIGHQHFPGCFRCHDDDFTAVKLAQGRTSRLDRSCDTCHAALASEADPARFDDTLGAMFPMK